MKKITFFILLFVNLSVNAQQWEWVRKANSTTAAQIPKKNCSDNLGNVFMLGNNEGKATYGTNLLDSGSFIVKYDSIGTLMWAEKIEGNPIDISCDGLGNLFVLGNFSGNITLGSFNLTSNGSSDMYLAKFSALGSCLWAKSFGGIKNDGALSLAVDDSSNCYVTGFYCDSVLFGNISLIDSTGATGVNFFLIKLNLNGNVEWANSGPQNFPVSNVKYVEGLCVKLTKAQDVFVRGYYGYGEGFIVKYNASGDLLLNKLLGAWMQYAKNTFALDDSSNIFFVWNSGTHYYYAPEMIKYDSLLNYKWTASLGGGILYTTHTLDNGLSTDAFGNTYVAGVLGGQSDSLQLCNQWLVRKGGADILVGKFNNSGNCVWYKSAGGKNNEWATDMFVDRKGNCYVMGVYNISYNNIYNDTVVFDNNVLTNDGSWKQIFIAKLIQANSTSGIQTNLSVNSFSLFPNPSSGIFTVNLRNSHAEAKITVRDVLGNCLLEKNCRSETSQEINLSSLPKGVYFLEILADGERAVREIVLQ